VTREKSYVIILYKGRLMQKKNNSNKNKIFSSRLMWLQVIFAVLVSGFILYLFCIQVIDVKNYRVKAKKQRKASSFILRGNIYDRNGIKLATDNVYYDIFARRDDFVHTPEELAKLLSDSGYNITQATVSRDIKDLKLIKVLGNDGVYKYVQSGNRENSAADKNFMSILVISITNIEYAMYIYNRFQGLFRIWS